MPISLPSSISGRRLVSAGHRLRTGLTLQFLLFSTFAGAGSASAEPAKPYSDYAVYVRDKFTAEEGARVERGSVGAASPSASLRLGARSAISSSHVTAGHHVTLGKGSAVGTVQTSKLDDNGGIHGIVSPLPAMPELPVRVPPPSFCP